MDPSWFYLFPRSHERTAHGAASSWHVYHLRSNRFTLRPLGKLAVQATAKRFQKEDVVVIIQPTTKRNKTIHTWNPTDPCFDWKRPCFGGLTFKNRGHLGSRFIMYVLIYYTNMWYICRIWITKISLQEPRKHTTQNWWLDGSMI